VFNKDLGYGRRFVFIEVATNTSFVHLDAPSANEVGGVRTTNQNSLGSASRLSGLLSTFNSAGRLASETCQRHNSGYSRHVWIVTALYTYRSAERGEQSLQAVGTSSSVENGNVDFDNLKARYASFTPWAIYPNCAQFKFQRSFIEPVSLISSELMGPLSMHFHIEEPIHPRIPRTICWKRCPQDGEPQQRSPVLENCVHCIP
jgi:hypothetical protein